MMELYQFATFIMVKERLPESGEWRNRYFGTGLTNVLGVEGTRKLVSDYHDAENTRKVIAFFDSIRNDRIPLQLNGQCIVLDRE